MATFSEVLRGPGFRAPAPFFGEIDAWVKTWEGWVGSAGPGPLDGTRGGGYGTIVQLPSGEADLDISVDTSTVMAVILNEPSKPALLRATRGADLRAAPSLPWEVGNALTALFKRGRINLAQAEKAMESFQAIPVQLTDVDIREAVKLSHEYGIYAYDAYVLECARRHGTPLLSLDNPQCTVARQLGIEVLEVES